jgi:periplasmic copper chaperone A
MFNRLAKAYLMTGSHFRSAALALTVAAAAPPAAAHVTIDPREAPAHSDFKAQLRVGHGCKGSPTVRVRVRLPEGAVSVKPQPKPGWQVESTRVKLAAPVDDGHGGKITETVGEVVWSGGRLLDEHFDEFAVMMRLPDRPGATLYFPVVQECEQGVHRWIEIPEAGKSASDYREPAPALRLTPRK